MAKDRVESGRGQGGGKPVGKQGGGAKPAAKVSVQRRDKTPFYMLLGGVAVIALGFILWQARGAKSSGVITIDPSVKLPEAAGYRLGKADAPVQVIEFADFECPACGTFATLTEPDVRKRLVETGIVSMRFLDYPLPAHLNTWDASMAAACANEQGKFWEMHDQIFATQDRWNTQATDRPRGILRGLAKDLALDMGKWDECFDTQKYKLNIGAHQREGVDRRIGSTPTFVIGSRMIPGALGYDAFKAYVDSALADRPGAADSAGAAKKK